MDYKVHGILQARITGVSSLSLLQGIFPTQGSNPGLPHCRRILYQLSHKPPKSEPFKNLSQTGLQFQESLADFFKAKGDCPLPAQFSRGIDWKAPRPRVGKYDEVVLDPALPRSVGAWGVRTALSKGSLCARTPSKGLKHYLA